MRTILPDYNNCCVNLINSVAKYYNLETKHATLPIVDKELQKDYKNVVILLLDGLGQNILVNEFPKDSFLRQNFIQELSAVYPSSTVPATVSIKTGYTPLEHAWWGHFLYFKGLGQTINVYTNNDAFSRKKVAIEDVAHTVMPYSNILDKICDQNEDIKAYCLCPAEARDNFGISQIIYNTFDEMSEYIQTLTSLSGKRVIYAYYNNPDDTMHKYGWNSPESEKLLNDIDSQVAVLCQKCSDTLFLITADHGQTLLKESRNITKYPDFLNTIYMMPTGCTRCASFYVKPKQEKLFLKLAKKYFGDKFAIYSKQDVLKNNLLGFGELHPELDNVLGDYLLCATSDCNITYSTLYGKPRAQPLGIHGGLTLDEMRVPLIMYGRK